MRAANGMRDRLKTGARNIGTSDDSEYSRMLTRGFDVDRPDMGMRMRRAHEYGACHAFDGEIVGVAAAPTDQAFVFLAAYGIADSCLLHAFVLLACPATAYNIPTALRKRSFGMAGRAIIPHDFSPQQAT
jgi:hypothetical protein